ncbi:hypothetical protein SY83_15315 [Paenibacillus swuensis]|uniref:Uncharacterized protein n=1 Tax=Paenibacillus swuensis TaxID=1178515 RepID=A0A172TK25_9BACL|nr:DUF1292 domain-containing protein [Paenibacillus swuensis]ANE47415.1 hypothetical protein SY83_15315 [Paenibacillus swuensis]
MSEHVHDENCNHDHEDQVFIITDADGNEHEMVMVYTFESEEQVYAVLLDKNNPEEDGVIFRIEEEGEEAFLESIEDEDEWNRVVAVYNQIAAEESENV